jgi:redox-sensitive bicupin YhaK (pirin superfamily)
MSAQIIPTRDATLGEGMTIRRALPSVKRRMIGAWCFLDHFGPVDVSRSQGMRVGPHPHTGLQTFTWPLAGEMLHRDSLGYEQIIRPGQVNLMTAGHGISHSEESPMPHSPLLHGAQLWIALPEAQRDCEPAFEHYPNLPLMQREGFRLTLLAGEALGERSPVRVHTPMIGMDLRCSSAAAMSLPLRPDFEYGVLVLDGAAQVNGEALAPGALLDLGSGIANLSVKADAACCLLLIGGAPFGEDVLLWWNFVGRSKQELTQFTREWNAGHARFGEVHGYDGARLTAPETPWG